MGLDIIDLHCDTMMACYFKKQSINEFEGHINIEKLKKGGCMAQALALFLPTDGHKTRDGRMPWDLYKDMLSCWNENVDANSDVMRRAFPQTIYVRMRRKASCRLSLRWKTA
jgi:membrane dipeptidase